MEKRWSGIESLVHDGGEITVGPMGDVGRSTLATDGYDAVAMLVRRPGESLANLPTRRDDAVRLAMEEETYTDEIDP